MKKFRPNWNDFESKRLMTSLKLHIPTHTIDEKTGLAILIAPPNLNKLQNIGKLLYELEKKIVFLDHIMMVTLETLAIHYLSQNVGNGILEEF